MFLVAGGSWDDAGVDESEDLDYQRVAVELCDGFTEHDSAALGELSADELVGQYEARLALDEYVAQMWEQARSGVRDPGVDPGLSAVAGLREVIAELLANAENAGAGD